MAILSSTRVGNCERRERRVRGKEGGDVEDICTPFSVPSCKRRKRRDRKEEDWQKKEKDKSFQVIFQLCDRFLLFFFKNTINKCIFPL